MDGDLYDEFGNYVGGELDSDDEEEEARFARAQQPDEAEDVEMGDVS